jgi:hypothetical protein
VTSRLVKSARAHPGLGYEELGGGFGAAWALSLGAQPGGQRAG